MYIKSLEYHDTASQWQLAQLKLDHRLALLVGISGVGKTQILRALLNLQTIASGRALNGIKWAIEFEGENNANYRWEGEFENQGFFQNFFEDRFTPFKEDISDKLPPKIIYEKLILNNQEILVRDKSNIILENKPTVQLSQHQSILELLKEEKKIAPANQAFKKIYFGNYKPALAIIPHVKIQGSKSLSLQEIRERPMDIKTKLYFAALYVPDIFLAIKHDFLDIFPYLEDLKIEPFKQSEIENMPAIFSEMPVIQIKENGITHWIHEGLISAGMFRTLMHITELHLYADDSVILIDEFENSLGVNCIDETTTYLTSNDRNLQFIITSHHPYIINHIPFQYWKLVTREAGKVIVRDATEYNLGKSKHEAFLQLINLEAYNKGIAK